MENISEKEKIQTPEPGATDTTAKPAQHQLTPQKHDEEDNDSDFDELDDVLDDFSKPEPHVAPVPAPAPDNALPDDFDEDAFLKQLENDMASLMSGTPTASASASASAPAVGAGGPDPPGFASVEQGAEAFAKELDESGIPPSEFLKQLLADVMAEAGETSGATGSNVKSTRPQQPPSFNDAIQRTVERMKESGDRATEAASADDGLSDDMLAQLLKAVEAGAGAGGADEGDMTKMFMGMMEQLSNKEMLYEPMRELDVKFGPWIEKSKAAGTVSAEDMARYEIQARVAKQIVVKFEEPGYSDEDSKCREYIWERMQEMQAAGSPPEDLISNPLMEDLGADSTTGADTGVPECPQQ
ncbi:hypothetical protein N7495_008217 [Penicillium taxi]|uniref:uncharacterized protein n=1 Tax=Penicillium taxi TaxID=168475 RepID=UPI002544FD8E|nr:uncharacterized protein N7495_008217 [Penicillium taxi]KAJ5888176.1 hypothetical protein N7495_008217 [Penicillium taxi]